MDFEEHSTKTNEFDTPPSSAGGLNVTSPLSGLNVTPSPGVNLINNFTAFTSKVLDGAYEGGAFKSRSVKSVKRTANTQEN